MKTAYLSQQTKKAGSTPVIEILSAYPFPYAF